MTEPNDIPTRVTRLEQAIVEVRREAAAARLLAAGADHDVSVIKDTMHAHTRSLNALRETQMEHGQRLDRLERKVDDGFAQVDANFERVDANFRQIDANFKQVDANFLTVGAEFSKVNTGIAQITALLTKKLDEPEQE